MSHSIPVGSGWDALPDSPDLLDHHLQEWVEGSAVDPRLARANLQSLAGIPVLEALVGDRLEDLGGWSHQFATAPVRRLLAPLEPVAQAGGWWCSGLDPLADWAPMDWGCFKPDAPRFDPERGRQRKYEHPLGVAARAIWLRVPSNTAARIASGWGLELPLAVAADLDGSAGAFWRWWAREPRLPLCVTEGAKKAGALLSAAVPAVALPGIWNGAPKDANGRARLLADLAGVPLEGRTTWVLFDWSDNAKAARDVARASRRLGGLLLKAGAAEVLVGTTPAGWKGVDDYLADPNGGELEDIADLLEPLKPQPALPHCRKPDRLAPDRWLSSALDDDLRSHTHLALGGAMGVGKTSMVEELSRPHLQQGNPLLAPTHRTSLGSAQAAKLGIPWAAELGSDERLQGTGLCWDSLRPSSGLRIRPDEWDGADGQGPVLVLDEVNQGIEHLLFGCGTAVAEHRLETMATAAELLRRSRSVLAMDAQLGGPVLNLLEALSGRRFHLVSSRHQPMAGRPVTVPQGLTMRTAAEQARAHVLRLAKAGKRAMVVTTAQQSHSKNSARNLARLVRRHDPDAPVLVIDSESPEAAELLGSNPNGVAAAHKWVIASPSITSGLSVDQLGVFDEVVVIGCSGRLTPEHLAQAAARVRDPGCPVTIYAPATAPQLRIGCGSSDPNDLLRHMARCEAQLLADLVGGASWDPTSCSPWLRCWLEMAALRNRQSHVYARTVAGLLEVEGWAVAMPAADASHPGDELVEQATGELAEIAEAASEAELIGLQEAPVITPAEAAELAKRRRLSAADRAKLQRHRLAQRWGLGTAPPTAELLEADRKGRLKQLRLHWLLLSPEARKLAAVHDHRRHQELARTGETWAPDLMRELLGHKLAAADAIGLPEWLVRWEWIADDDPALVKLHKLLVEQPCPAEGETLEDEALRRVENHRRAERRGTLTAALGVSPGKRASGTLRNLVGLAGFKLEARRRRSGDGRRRWEYRLVNQDLPAGVDGQQLLEANRQWLAGSPAAGVSTFFPITNRGDQ